MILTLASIVGAAKKGEALVASLEQGLEEIRAAGNRLERRPKVYFEEWDEPMISAIRIVAPEQVRERNPDVILGSWCGKKFRPERVAARPGWHEIAAVKENRLYEIKSADILQPGPAALTDGVRRIHEILRRFSDSSSGTRAQAAG